MNVNLARIKATGLMTKHNLIQNNWKFSFNKRTTSFGVCKFKTKEIQLSIHLTEAASEEKVVDTILHEIAHALVGLKHGHDLIWQKKAIEIGCNGERCGDIKNDFDTLDSLQKFQEVVKEKKSNYKYKLVCPNCDHEIFKRSLPKRSCSCIKCCPSHYNPDYKLKIKIN
jgi:predicted SprT family Zn-dependent metalloprotease